MAQWLNWQVVKSLLRRDLRLYFSNPTGYVFITLFIFLSAAAAFWQERFFLNNLANLDQLNEVFPYLLLFFVPALTMSVWADERKQGTDELLLTLPANDLEVVLGKYLATFGIYTTALILSLSHVLVLFWLGSPDLGLMLGNYFGYWLIGAAFIAIGMLASLLTANATIAFILGAAFCSLFVFIDYAAGIVSAGLSDFLAPLGVSGHFGDFASGVVSFSGLLYFLSVTGFLISMNVLLISRRHWPREADGYPMWIHHLIRAVAVVVLLISANALIGRASLRLDVTAERLHSLSRETRQLLSELPEESPVLIQAYASPEVPEQYVQVRANLLGTLQEVSSMSGGRVEVLVKDTVAYSEEAREAREKFGIASRQIPSLGNARASFADVFLGVAVTSGAQEQVIPFLDRGLSAEYEIVRAIRVVAHTQRKKIGVVNTAIRLFGGMDFQTFRSTPPWSVVEELKKQYEVVQISAASPITEELDGLLVVLPSSMPQEEMSNVLEYVEKGRPALFLVDPLPVIDMSLSPSEDPGAGRNPFMNQGQPPPQPKGNIRSFMSSIGVQWDPGQIIWDTYNPHPDLAHLPPEVVFVGRGNQNEEAFNGNDSSSASLQELVFLYPGSLQPLGTGEDFVPLVRTGRQSGGNPYFQMVRRSFFGAQLNPNPPRRPGGQDFVVAARIRSGSQAGEADSAVQEGEDSTDRGIGINAIVIADLDFISEQFFQIRQIGPPNLNFDNVTFFLNSMDVLVGDESFVALRSKRVKHRTLERVEEQTQEFIDRRVADEQRAEEEAEKALAEAQKRLDEKVNLVRERTDLDAQAKQFMVRNEQEVENRRFEVLKANIEAEKEAKIQEGRERMEASIRRIQSNIRTFAVLLPPIPVFVLGVWIFFRRQRREREGAAAVRRLRG